MFRRFGNGKFTPRPRRDRSKIVGGIRLKRRYAQLAEAFIRQMAAGKEVHEAMIAAATECGMGGLCPPGDDYKLRAMKNLLKNPDFSEAVRGVYEVGGFNLKDAVAMHVLHIKGNKKKDIAPNYVALRDYLKTAIPQAPTRTLSVVAHVRQRDNSDGPPKMNPRPIGTVIEQ